MITVSVVIPVYNRRQYLITCLDSVAAQRRPPDEIIVVDDGSTDGTLDGIANRPEVKIVVQDNAGPGAARNLGARIAKGDYIAFLDSDDLWFPWSLDAMVTLIERFNPSLLSGHFQDFRDIPSGVDSAPDGAFFSDYLEAGPAHYVGAGLMLVRREAFLQAGGFVEDRLNAEDHDLALRLGTAPGFVQTLAPVTLARRVHSGNAMGDAAANVAGLMRLIRNEEAGLYPAGSARRLVRRAIIAAHARSAVLGAISAGRVDLAFALYRATFAWNVLNRRFAFIAGAPVLMIGGLLRRSPAPAR